MPSVLESYPEENGFRMVVAGGGTGGHLFPGIALAQAFTTKHFSNQVLFVNAGRMIEVTVLQQLGWPMETIPIEGIKGRGIAKQLKASFMIPRAVWRARSILKAFAPHVVLGVGGYSAGPVVMAAWLMGIPTVLHEQNQLPGLTNRLLRRVVDRIYLTFTDDAERFDPEKTLVAGNPVRDEFLILNEKKVIDPERFDLLVLGGSQGAHAINQAMIEALPQLVGQAGLHVTHQTGAQDEDMVAQAYEQSGVSATVKRFFNNVADLYHHADLIIGRAGATTVAEITAVGRAAVFVPFPHAADDHQTGNARALVTAGAAEMIPQKELSGSRMAKTIIFHMQHRDQLAEMADKARSLGRPEAALTIVNDIYELIGKESVGP